MNRNKSQVARLAELDRQIRSRRYPNCISFAEEWGVSQKTIQRDIDFLRDQNGAPIEYCREHKGFFYTSETWILPSIILTEGEMFALLMSARALGQYEGTPVAGQLKRVWAKLSDLLPEKITLRPEYLFSRFTFRGPPVNAVSEKIWCTVVQGLLSQRVLKVVYRPFDSAVQTGKSSRICPYHMANLQGEWYLFGVHEGHDDVRQFALARIEQAEVTRKPYSIPEDFQAGELLDTAFGRYVGNGQARNVRLVFQKEIAEWITTRQWHPLQNLKRRGNGDIELSFSTEGMFEVQRWVLSWGRWVKVLEPRELVESVAAEVTVMASYHAHTQGVKHGKERSR